MHQSVPVHEKSKEVMWRDKTVDRKGECVKDRINEVLKIVHNSYVLISLLRTNRLLSKSSHALYVHLSSLYLFFYTGIDNHDYSIFSM